MTDLDKVYADLAKGAGEPPTDPRVIDALLDRVFRARGSDQVTDRMAALRVAESIGGRYGLDLVETFMDDPAIEVRRYAFNLGLAAKKDGLRIVREAGSDPDTELALQAMALLTRAQDKSSTMMARGLLEKKDPRIRAASARLLGQVAGLSVTPAIRSLLDDRDPQVVAAAQEALDFIEGRRHRPAPMAWWSDGPEAEPEPHRDPGPAETAPPVPPPPAEPAAEASAPSEAPEAPVKAEAPEPEAPAPQSPRPPLEPVPIPPARDDNETINPDEEVSFEGPAKAALAGAGPVHEGLVPAHVDTELEPIQPPEIPWSAGETVPLPATMPTEAYALIRLLGMVSEEDRKKVLFTLRDSRTDEVAAVVYGHRVGGDPARGRGICVYATATEQRSWITVVRKLVADPEPLVRAAAVEALGAIGGPAVLTQVARSLEDDSVEVRIAAVRSLGAAAKRLDIQHMLPNWLGRLGEDPSPQVREARDAALAESNG